MTVTDWSHRGNKELETGVSDGTPDRQQLQLTEIPYFCFDINNFVRMRYQFDQQHSKENEVFAQYSTMNRQHFISNSKKTNNNFINY